VRGTILPASRKCDRRGEHRSASGSALTIGLMESCKIASCTRDGYATAWTDFVTPSGEVFLVGPVALCTEHASVLERFMVEVRYPDGRVVKAREPGQPLQPPEE
jgi:hypothetical protein